MGVPYCMFCIHYLFLLFTIILLDEANRVQGNREVCLRWHSHQALVSHQSHPLRIVCFSGSIITEISQIHDSSQTIIYVSIWLPCSHLICSNCSDCKCVRPWGISQWSWPFSTQIFPCHLVDYNYLIENFVLEW